MNFWKRIGLVPLALLVPALILFGVSSALQGLNKTSASTGSSLNTKVMVVNEDQPVTVSGQTLSAGNNLVSKLKDDHQLNWVFVSASEAQQALADHQALISLVIPADFSKNTASLLSDNPQQANLQIQLAKDNTPISGALFGTVGNTLRDEVAQTVQQNYGTQLLDGLTQLSDGTKAAADGAKQVADGNAQLASGVPALVTGANQLSDGAQKLLGGTSQLASNAPALVDGTNQLAAGANKLAANTPLLSNGINQVNTGAGQLSSGINQLASKAPALADGANQLSSGASQLQAGLSTATSSQQQLAGGVKQLVDSITGTNGVINQIQSGQDTSKTQMAQLTIGLNTLTTSLQQLGNAQNPLTLDIAKQGQTVNTNLTTAGTSLTNLIASGKLSQSDPNVQALIAALQNTGAAGTQLNTDLTTLNSSLTQLSQQGPVATQGALQAINQLNTSLDTIKTSFSNQSTQLAQLAGGEDQLTSGLTQLNAAAGQISAGSTQLAQSTPALITGINQLNDGATQLSSGTSQLSSNMPALVDGSNQLATGASQLASKAPLLADGINQLNDGAGQLANGTTQLAQSVPTLQSGTDQLASGSSELATKLAAGVSQLPTIKNENGSVLQLAAPVATTLVGTTTITYKDFFAPSAIMLGLFLGSVLLQLHGWYARKEQLDGQLLLEGLVYLPIGATIGVLGVAALMNIQVSHWTGLGIAVLVSSMVFTSVAGFLSRAFGRLGAVIGIVLALLQVAFATQILPTQLLGGFGNATASVLPGTYVTSWVSNMISNNGAISTTSSIIVLVMFGIVALVGSYLVNFIKLNRLTLATNPK